eukprot:TRINITY_DN22278_c0_g1_i1.p1 TRINITY_DN22278_c0_g1~~TRINITY_DN22278_c0_g1_i1.p1  ORF type:complete len:142 (+),score=6.99 TRINITY_DN22278_c0_g1_i1:355-780(+)
MKTVLILAAVWGAVLGNTCDDEAKKGCVACSEGEIETVRACRRGGWRKVVCDGGEWSHVACEGIPLPRSEKDGSDNGGSQAGEDSLEIRPQSVRSVLRNNLYSFELVCLILAVSCGLFMQHRKALLIAQQQHRYFKLIERT